MSESTDEALGRDAMIILSDETLHLIAEDAQRAWEQAPAGKNLMGEVAKAVTAHVRAEQRAARAALEAEHAELERRLAYLDPLVRNPATRTGALTLAWIYAKETLGAGRNALTAAPLEGAHYRAMRVELAVAEGAAVGEGVQAGVVAPCCGDPATCFHCLQVAEGGQ